MNSPELYWLEQKIHEVPAYDEWLSVRERERMTTMKIPKRKDEYRLGRWCAKRALSTFLGDFGDQLDIPYSGSVPLNSHGLSVSTAAAMSAQFGEMEVLPAEDGAPEVWLDSQKAPLSISISHSNGVAMCLLCTGQVEMGCDVESVVERSAAFLKDYFTEAEFNRMQEFQDQEREVVMNLIWSAKESALKALREGLRIDTRKVVVEFDWEKPPHLWQPLTVHSLTNQRTYQGWWMACEQWVRTLVAWPTPKTVQKLYVE